MKIYIKTHLKTRYIWPSKCLTSVPILFNKKHDSSFYLCIDYQDINNLTIRNRYSFLLIGELLDQLSQAKKFTQLDLTNAYYQIRIQEDDKWKTNFRTWYNHFGY